MSTASLTFALAGNPNSGKTTIFNSITGARQHVGNYPGVTVERREGFRRFDGMQMLVVDLPGIYSLTAHSLDEMVTRDFIVYEKPDVIVNILDASNLERNLYLALQLLEMERPMVMVLNMADVAENMGIEINDQLLSQKMGVPIIRTVGNRSQGIDALLHAVLYDARHANYNSFIVDYGPDIEGKITQLQQKIAGVADNKYPARWLAIKLLEADPTLTDAMRRLTGGTEVADLAETFREEIRKTSSEEPELIIAERRYVRISEVYQHITKSLNDKRRITTDDIDGILTHRVWGFPIFFGLMWLLFNMVFTLGAYPQEWIEAGFARFGEFAGRYLAEGELKSLLVDGIVGGVGGVVVFVPHILILFFGIALLEDTGYMARAAFIMDRLMRAVGLHGKSFIPLLVGFGCTVPAVMSARTLENPHDRMVTILVSPLMSCSARLPVYTVLIGAFFPETMAGTMLFLVYTLGIALAVMLAVFFRKYLFPGAPEPFVMEMPLYHVPTLRSILTHMWERALMYLKKAATLILAMSIIVWFLTTYPSDVKYSKDYNLAKAQVMERLAEKVRAEVLNPLQLMKAEDSVLLTALMGPDKTVENQFKIDATTMATRHMANLVKSKQQLLNEIQDSQPELYLLIERYMVIKRTGMEEIQEIEKEKAAEKLTQSYAGQLGRSIEPAIRPLGFDWKIGVGLLAAFAAKEVLVSTLGTIYSVGEDENDSIALQEALTADTTFTPLIACSLMAFVLIYAPCMAALAVIRRETNSWRWTAFTFVYTTCLAWVIAFIIYQGGRALGY